MLLWRLFLPESGNETLDAIGTNYLAPLRFGEISACSAARSAAFRAARFLASIRCHSPPSHVPFGPSRTVAQWNCDGVSGGPAMICHGRSLTMALGSPLFTGFFEDNSATDDACGFKVAPEAGSPSVPTLSPFADQPCAAFLLDRLLADPATVQIEAVVTPAGAERLPIVGDRRRQFRLAVRIAASAPHLVNKFGHMKNP
jgi:hypothetical protein